MNSKDRYTTAGLEDDSYALAPRAIEELPKLHHGADDAAYMDWLNTILQKRDKADSTSVSTPTARRSMNE